MIERRRGTAAMTVFAAMLVLLVAAGGCATSRAPEMGRLYDRAAQQSDLDRNPVIVIPGVLGSKLAQASDGTVVWGAFTGEFANPEKPAGARLLALPMAPGVPLRDLRDDVVPTGVLDDLSVNLLFFPVAMRAYRNVLATLGVGGYRDEELGRAGAVDYGDEHFTCFQFPYDWRRDNVESARLLHEFIVEKKQFVRAGLRARYGVDRPDLRFDIVAHSMGGLVTRYMLRYGDADLPDDGPVPAPTWAGASLVERVVLVGTPNAGSVSTVRQLVEDTTFAPIIPTYPAAVIGTMPAVYQLLPRDRHGAVVDAVTGAPLDGLYDVARWEARGWGLASPASDRVLERLLPDVADPAERRRIAVDHLDKCLRRAERFHAALDTPHEPPPGVALHLFAGDAVSTPARLAVGPAPGRLAEWEEAPGDGTVVRTSAVMDERLDGDWSARLRTPVAWTSVQFLFSDHLGLTKDPAFTDNVLFLLLESP